MCKSYDIKNLVLNERDTTKSHRHFITEYRHPTSNKICELERKTYKSKYLTAKRKNIIARHILRELWDRNNCTLSDVRFHLREESNDSSS